MTIQAAAERLRKHRTDWSEEYRNTQQGSDEATLAVEYLRLTDPTPITPELLHRVGFTQISGARAGDLELGSLQVSANSKHWAGQWVVCTGSKFDHIWYPPRTLGELRQLANRIGITLQEQPNG